MTIVPFRLALDRAVDARALESLCETLAITVVDVNPRAVIVDPLTMESHAGTVVSVQSGPEQLAELLDRWRVAAGSTGLVLDKRVPTITACLLEDLPVESVVEVERDGLQRSTVGAGGQRFRDAMKRMLASEPSELGARKHRAETARDSGGFAGLSPTFLRTHTARVASIREMWQSLLSCVPPEDQAAAERANRASFRYEPNLALAALTLWNDAYTVRLDLGMIETLAESSRSIVGEVASTKLLDGAESAFDGVGIRISHSLGWLTSLARFPMPTRHALSDEGEKVAQLLATGALLFVLAHELAHVLADDSAPTAKGVSSWAKELRADRNALELLARFVRSDRSAEVPALPAGVVVTLEIVAGGAATFLAFEGLRQLVKATQQNAALLPWPEDVVELTHTETHPSPFTRLTELGIFADTLDQSGEAGSAIRGAEQGFRALWPEVQHNLPEWVMTLSDAQTIIETHGYDPDRVDIFVGQRIGDVAREDILQLLRDLPADRDISPDVVEYIERAAGSVPRSVVDTLARARVGQGLDSEDPDAERIRSAALRLTSELTPLLMRYAVRGELGDIIRDVVSAIDSHQD